MKFLTIIMKQLAISEMKKSNKNVTRKCERFIGKNKFITVCKQTEKMNRGIVKNSVDTSGQRNMEERGYRKFVLRLYHYPRKTHCASDDNRVNKQKIEKFNK